MIILLVAYLSLFLIGFNFLWLSNSYDELRLVQVVLTLIVGGFSLFRYTKNRVSQKKIIIGMLFLILILIGLSLNHQLILYKVYDLLMWLSAILLFFALNNQNFVSEKNEFALAILILLSVIPCLNIFFSFIQLINKDIFFGWQMNAGSIRIYDSVVVPIFWIAVYLYKKNKYIKNLYPVICFFIALALFVDGARSALISLLIPLILLFLLDQNYKKIILKTFLYFFIAFITYQGFYYYYNLIHEQEKSLSIARYTSSYRSEIWLYMFELWTLNPFRGVGGGHLAQIEYPYAHHMHNVYLRLIFEWGFIGCVVLIWILSKIYHLLKSDVNVVLKMGVIAILIDGMFSGNFIYPASQVACVLFLALAFSQLPQTVSEHGSARFLNTKTLYMMTYLFFVVLVFAYLKEDMQCVGCSSKQGRAAPFFWEHGASINLDKQDE